jgi:hypothetical protein
MIQQSHSEEYSQRNVTQFASKTPAHLCLLQHCSQWISNVNSQDAPTMINGLRKCGTYT